MIFFASEVSPNQAKVVEAIFGRDGLGGGFKYLFFLIPIWGNDPI